MFSLGLVVVVVIDVCGLVVVLDIFDWCFTVWVVFVLIVAWGVAFYLFKWFG